MRVTPSTVLSSCGIIFTSNGPLTRLVVSASFPSGVLGWDCENVDAAKIRQTETTATIVHDERIILIAKSPIDGGTFCRPCGARPSESRNAETAQHAADRGLHLRVHFAG